MRRQGRDAAASTVPGASCVAEFWENGPDDVYVERKRRIEKVNDRPFEGEEPIVHLMG